MCLIPCLILGISFIFPRNPTQIQVLVARLLTTILAAFALVPAASTSGQFAIKRKLAFLLRLCYKPCRSRTCVEWLVASLVANQGCEGGQLALGEE